MYIVSDILKSIINNLSIFLDSLFTGHERVILICILHERLSIQNRLRNNIDGLLFREALHEEGHEHVFVEETLPESFDFVDHTVVDCHDAEHAGLQQRLDNAKFLQNSFLFLVPDQSIEVVEHNIKIKVFRSRFDFRSLIRVGSPSLQDGESIFKDAERSTCLETQLGVDIFLD